MKLFAKLLLLVPKVIDHILMIILTPLFRKHGQNIKFYPLSSNFSYDTIALGNDVFIGTGARFNAATRIDVGNKVMFGPNVTIMGGDHNFSVVGEYMFDVKEKLPENDLPVIVEDDVWVGSGVIILKGVTISRGAVVAAGAVVTRDVSAYSIVAGVPAKHIGYRFTEQEIQTHEDKLKHIQTFL